MDASRFTPQTPTGGTPRARSPTNGSNLKGKIASLERNIAVQDEIVRAPEPAPIALRHAHGAPARLAD